MSVTEGKNIPAHVKLQSRDEGFGWEAVRKWVLTEEGCDYSERMVRVYVGIH